MPGRKKRNHDFDTAAHARRLLKSRSTEEQRRIIAQMAPHDALMFDADFEMWANDGQLPPADEGWRTWLMMAGRGFGKTRAGAEWIYRLATHKAGSRIALVGASIGEGRSIMIEGVSGLLSIARRHRRRVEWEPSLGRFKWELYTKLDGQPQLGLGLVFGFFDLIFLSAARKIAFAMSLGGAGICSILFTIGRPLGCFSAIRMSSRNANMV